MHPVFEKFFEKSPRRIEEGVYYYDVDSDGDLFDDGDVGTWRNKRFDDSWEKKGFLENRASGDLLDRIVARQSPIVDLACGPGMGLIPSVKRLAPSHVCLAADASSLLISEWKKYADQYLAEADLSFAQFSLKDIPFRDDSVPAYTCYIGIGAVRGGIAGQRRALAEIYRTLAPGGYVYLIEDQWSPVERILEAFEKMKKTPWEAFLDDRETWPEKFQGAGFRIEYEKEFRSCRLGTDDNELGAAAKQYGFEITITDTAYILQK